MEKNPTWQPVVAAAITGADGAVLLQRRPVGKHHGGLWEFPGGKVEPGETPCIALAREIEEELGIVLDAGALEPLAFAESPPDEDYPAIVILLYKTGRWRGEPRALEGGEWGWFGVEAAGTLAMPPLDVLLLEHYRQHSQKSVRQDRL